MHEDMFIDAKICYDINTILYQPGDTVRCIESPMAGLQLTRKKVIRVLKTISFSMYSNIYIYLCI